MFRLQNYSLVNFIFLLLFAFYSFSLFGQDCPLEKLTASDGVTTDMMGRSVYIGETYAIVGAPEKDGSQGTAYIYKFNGSTWQQTAILSGSENTDYRSFGTSVFIDDEFAIIGTYTQSYVYVFKREGETWVEKAILTGDQRSGNPFNSESFGWSLSMEGDLLIVGAYSEDTRGVNNAGAAYIFKRNDNTGTSWTRQAKLEPPQLAYGDGFGYSVAISGNIAIVTSAYDGSFDNNTPGAAYIFERKGNTWTQQIKLKTAKKHPNGLFGMDSDVYQNPLTGERIALVGNDSWGVHVYKYLNNSWKQTQFIGDSTKATGGRFGFSVDMQDDKLLIGQPYLSAAWLYNYKAGTFEFTQRFEAPDKHDFQQFGHSVAISQDASNYIFGAQADNEKGERAGAAYVLAQAYIKPVPPLCSKSNTINLTAFPSGGSWQGNGIINSTGMFDPNTAGLGKHRIIYSYNGLSCLLRDTIEIEVRDKPLEIAIENPNPVQICPQSSFVELTATKIEGQQYKWQYSTTIDGLYTDAPGENTFSYYQADRQGYYRVSYGLQGCTLIATVPVYVEHIQISVSTTSAQLCRGKTASLSVNGNPGKNYQWMFSATGYIQYTEAKGESSQATYQATSKGFYRVLVTFNNCQFLSETIEVKEVFTEVSINPPIARCIDQSPVQLSGLPEGGSWAGKGVSSTGIFDPSQAGAGNHIITYIVTTASGCSFSNTTSILVKPLPKVEVLSNPVIPFCANKGVTVSVTANPQADYSWEYMPSAGGVFQPMQASSSSSITVSTAGFYRVKVDQEGCVAYSLPVELVAIKDSTEFPNVFTPNGDGVNDTFEPIVENADHYQLEIYNRLGRRVFASSGTTSQWDGRGFPTGVYFWQIRYNTVCDKELKILKGVVSILY